MNQHSMKLLEIIFVKQLYILTVQWLQKLHYGIEKGLNEPLGDSFGLCGSQKG